MHSVKYAIIWHIRRMARMDASGRLARLDELAGLLRSREFATTAELAALLGTSIRTLRRDLEVLRERGVPVEADRGRGGGLRLGPAWSAGRIHLNSGEALALLLSVAITEKLGSPLLLGAVTPLRRKIAAAFSPPDARRILTLRGRVLFGNFASSRVVSTYDRPGKHVLAPLADAFFGQRLARIRYQDQLGQASERTIEAHFLYYNLPVWYVLAWDRLRDSVRFFRIDRIREIELEPAGFRLGNASRFLAAGEADVRSL